MRRLQITLAALVALAALGLPASAMGAANHPFLHAGEPLYEDACGLAQQGGGLYVSDYYRDRVLTPSGQISPESQGSGPCKLGLDAAGDLYVNDWHEKVVKYSGGELAAGAGTVIDSDSPTGLWVEQASGDLYVAHRTYIAKYDATGTLLAQIGGGGELREAYGVAVSEYPSTLGDIYVPDAATETIKVFDQAGDQIGEMDGAATPEGHFTYFRDGEVVIDNTPTSPSYGHLFVLDAIGHGLSSRPAAVIDEFNAAGAYRGQITGFTDAEPSAIVLDPTSHNLYVTSGNSEGSQVFEYGPTAPAKTLTVAKEGAGDGTLTSGPVGIACGEACSAEFNEGQVVTLFANPDGHSAFTGWSVTGSQPCPGTGSCTVTLSANVEVKASFAEPPQQTLSLSLAGEGAVASAPAGIQCPGVCSAQFAEARLITLKATPAAHQRLASWSGCTVQANPLECKVTMAAAESVTATFAPIPQQSLAVSLVGGGQGTVTSFPAAISCPGACSGSFDQGSTVYLMAAPAPGSGFGGFAGGGCAGPATLCAVSMDGTKAISATFTGAARGPAAAAAASQPQVSLARTLRGAALLRVRSPEAGTLLLASAQTQPLERQLRAGTSTLRLKLRRRARRALARRGRLRLGLSLGFIPAAAPAASRQLALCLHRARPKSQRRR